MPAVAFQDQIPNNHCFGCGPDNTHGLRIKSYWEGEDAVCTYHASPHQNAGTPEFLNGGIIATLVDCHSICTAVADAYRREGRAIGTYPLVWYVTGSLTVHYLQPTPIDQPVTLQARIIRTEGKKTQVHCTMACVDDECVTAEVLAVRVSESWTAGHR